MFDQCLLYLVAITIDRLLFEGEQVFETAVGFYWVLRGLGVRPGWVVVLYSVAKHLLSQCLSLSRSINWYW